jgi:hypothetical protein
MEPDKLAWKAQEPSSGSKKRRKEQLHLRLQELQF